MGEELQILNIHFPIWLIIEWQSLLGCDSRAGLTIREQSRLNVLGGPGPARLMGPLSSLWPTWRGGTIVLCTSESGNTHLGPSQGQT